MAKRGPVLVIMLMCLAVQFASAQTIAQKKQLRHQLLRAVDDGKTTDSLYKSLLVIPNRSPLINGYIATLQALQAKYSWNPYTKLKQVNNAEKTFDKSITADPHNLELRFMRYAVEVQTPKSLDLSAHVNEDKGILIEALRKYPKSDFTKETATIARDFLKQNCSCSEEEKQVLENVKI